LAPTRLAEKHGRKSLKNATHRGAAFDPVAAYDKFVSRMPVTGTLHFEFRSHKRPQEVRDALTTRDFEALWTQLVERNPAGRRTAQAGVTVDWALELLATLCLDHYFTSAQVQTVVRSFVCGEDRVEAASRLFARVVDPEEWHTMIAELTTEQRGNLHDKLGPLAAFNPKNPTGAYELLLVNRVHAAVAARLVELYRQQLSKKYCRYPLQVCFQECTHNGAKVDVSDPAKIVVPRSGSLSIIFVDLTPVPPGAAPMSAAAFAVLLVKLVNEKVKGEGLGCTEWALTLTP